MKKLVFAIVGRANVGKSTLFNRLIKRKYAIVYDFPGVTRDRKIAEGYIGDQPFVVIDTPGFGDPETPKNYPELMAAMQQQTNQAIAEADVILFVVDGLAGCTAYDQEFSTILHKTGKKIILLVNKTDSLKNNFIDHEFYKLGIEEIVAISAENGNGINELYSLILYALPKAENSSNEDMEVETIDQEILLPPKPLNLVIIGRPSAGKSTLINSLLKEERMLTGATPGITRDAITVSWQYNDQLINLIDTAGRRRYGKIDQTLEKIALANGQKALQFADIAIVVIDGNDLNDQNLVKQDLNLARKVLEEGRGLVIAINKTDKIRNTNNLMNMINYQLQHHLAAAPCIDISARTGKNLDKLMQAVLSVYAQWNYRVNTSALNRWFTAKITAHPAPMIAGRRIKLKYITQTKSRPPSFTIFGNQVDSLPDHYIKYLTNNLRQDFNFNGVPLRIKIKTNKNPYKD